MAKAPAYLMYAQDFDMDTASWTNEEIGIYTRLLNYEWVNGAIPADIESIARIVREPLPDKNKRFRQHFDKKLGDFHVKIVRILAKFTPNSHQILNGNGSGFLINSRMELEREKQRQYSEKQSEKGKYGAKKRWENKMAGAITTPMAQPQPNHSFSFSSSLNPPIVPPKKPLAHKPKSSEFFSQFWNAYPKKVARLKSLKIWIKLDLDNLISSILTSLESQKQSEQWIKDNGQFIPHPTKYLNERRWEDQIESSTKDDNPYSNYEIIKPIKENPNE